VQNVERGRPQGAALGVERFDNDSESVGALAS
jgi:hypothetical protein